MSNPNPYATGAQDAADDDSVVDILTGDYANFVSVGSTQTEFYIDFMQVVPGSSSVGGEDQVLPVRRLLISPMLVRGLMRALEQEIGNYEGAYHITLPMVES